METRAWGPLAAMSQSTGHMGHMKGGDKRGLVNVEFWCARDTVRREIMGLAPSYSTVHSDWSRIIKKYTIGTEGHKVLCNCNACTNRWQLYSSKDLTTIKKSILKRPRYDR